MRTVHAAVVAGASIAGAQAWNSIDAASWREVTDAVKVEFPD